MRFILLNAARVCIAASHKWTENRGMKLNLHSAVSNIVKFSDFEGGPKVQHCFGAPAFPQYTTSRHSNSDNSSNYLA